MNKQRLYELLPATLAWGTLAFMVFASWKLPVAAAIFIILFDTYWLSKSVYLSFHLRSTFKNMRQNLAVDWREKLETGNFKKSWKDIYHLVILPMSKEPYEVVRESFESLRRVRYPKDRLLVVLAIEERVGESARAVAGHIEAGFGNDFGKFLITTHPAGLPNEIPGKGSNETWAGKEAKRLLIDSVGLRYENVMVSVFDCDTQVPEGYFGRLTHVFLTVKNPLRAVYQPIPLFTNNVYEAPALARVVAFSCTFWQMMQQARPERLTTFSSQSLPFQVLVDIGFWDRDIVSEDSRIFWQGFFAYHGDFRAEPLCFPVYMDMNVGASIWETLKNIYKQQRRWGWGVENLPYMLSGFAQDKTIPLRKRWYWTFNVIETFHSWATNSILIFALGWLPVALGGATFRAMLLSYSLPRITRWIITLSMLGIVSSAIVSVVLLPRRPKWFLPWKNVLFVLQWALLPITLILFGALPGLEAQTRLFLGGKYRLGFWITPKSRTGKS